MSSLEDNFGLDGLTSRSLNFLTYKLRGMALIQCLVQCWTKGGDLSQAATNPRVTLRNAGGGAGWGAAGLRTPEEAAAPSPSPRWRPPLPSTFRLTIRGSSPTKGPGARGPARPAALNRFGVSDQTSVGISRTIVPHLKKCTRAAHRMPRQDQLRA